MQRVLMRFVRAATHRLVTRRRQRSARRRARWLRRHHQHQCRSRRRKRGTSACSPSRAGRLRGSARASPRRASAVACTEKIRGLALGLFEPADASAACTTRPCSRGRSALRSRETARAAGSSAAPPTRRRGRCARVTSSATTTSGGRCWASRPPGQLQQRRRWRERCR